MRLRGGKGNVSPVEFNQQVICIGTTITDLPKVGKALAVGSTGYQDVGGTLPKYWKEVAEVDRETYPGRLMIAGVVSAPKAYLE